MAYITSTVPQATGTVIATVGTDEVYVELSLRRLGEVIHLTAIMIQYNAYTGKYLRDEVGCEIADDGEDAISAAEDLEHIAHHVLDGMGCLGYKSCGFAEAVEKALDSDPDAERAYLETAIEYNAALIAAE